MQTSEPESLSPAVSESGPHGDLMVFLHTLESVFDQYCDQMAQAQTARLMAACRRRTVPLQWQPDQD